MIDTLYILSAGHSGSTMLNLILGSHSRSVAVSELTRLPTNIALNETCTCGKGIRECPTWHATIEVLKSTLNIDAFAHPYGLELGYIGAERVVQRSQFGPRYRMAWKARRALIYLAAVANVPLPEFMRRKFNEGIRNRLAVYDAIRKVTDSALVIDASKEYLSGVALYQQRPERTRLILLVRDGRAVFYSNLKRGFGRSHSLDAWCNYYRHALPVLRAGVKQEHVLQVRYEDLATAPMSEVRRICEFAGIAFEPSMLDFVHKEHHITSGNNMRLKGTSEIRLDTTWRTALQHLDKAHFEKRAGAMNRRMGYR